MGAKRDLFESCGLSCNDMNTIRQISRISCSNSEVKFDSFQRQLVPSPPQRWYDIIMSVDRRTPGQKLMDAAEEMYEAMYDLLVTKTPESTQKRVEKHEQKKKTRAGSFANSNSRGRPRFTETLPVQEIIQPVRVPVTTPGANRNGNPRFSAALPTQQIVFNSSSESGGGTVKGRPRFSNNLPTQRC